MEAAFSQRKIHTFRNLQTCSCVVHDILLLPTVAELPRGRNFQCFPIDKKMRSEMENEDKNVNWGQKSEVSWEKENEDRKSFFRLKF